MTRRDLTKEEEKQIPVYLDSPFFEDNICYANWDDQLVWSKLGVSPCVTIQRIVAGLGLSRPWIECSACS